jgi:hypothetical protein
VNNRKNHNSILFLTTLGVYLGLLIFGSGVLYAQPARNNHGVMIDKKPLRDFAESIKRKVTNKEVNLAAPFSVEMEVYLTQNGSLTQKELNSLDLKAKKMLSS